MRVCNLLLIVWLCMCHLLYCKKRKKYDKGGGARGIGVGVG